MSEKALANNNGNNLAETEKIISELAPDLLNGIPATKKKQLLSFLSLQICKTHKGPLPDAATLREYSELIPNGADRVMTMAEEQSRHRMYLEKKAVRGQINQSFIGQVLAFTLAIFLGLVSAYCALQGHDTYSSILGGSTIVSLVIAFIKGKNYQRRNLDEKNPKKN